VISAASAGTGRAEIAVLVLEGDIAEVRDQSLAVPGGHRLRVEPHAEQRAVAMPRGQQSPGHCGNVRIP
jgi:hypothetical protein